VLQVVQVAVVRVVGHLVLLLAVPVLQDKAMQVELPAQDLQNRVQVAVEQAVLDLQTTEQLVETQALAVLVYYGHILVTTTQVVEVAELIMEPQELAVMVAVVPVVKARLYLALQVLPEPVAAEAEDQHIMAVAPLVVQALWP
jgi:hypothetical protein